MQPAGVASQVKYNIFERKPEETGLIQLCRDLNVTLVAHSPLQQGLLTGVHLKSTRIFSAFNPSYQI